MTKESSIREICYSIIACIVISCLFHINPIAAKEDMKKDIHSFARPDEAIVKHLDLDIHVDFEKKRISGKAHLHIDNKTKTDKLYLDTRGLHIKEVTLQGHEVKTKFILGEQVKYLGRPLIIDITPETEWVHIDYNTSPDAAALQWLKPAQTSGGKDPFLFTQSQAILARTWIPCQDSPGIRMTYTAKVKVRPGLMAIMSAENSTERTTDGVYSFRMPQPIPAYLLALAVGDIDFLSIGKRSGVYAEPSVVTKASWEFADTEKMIVAAEKLYGPYRWGRYDIIVLPPSFPFGGMENPRLTFATPTILAGDRSLVSLIAHELAHSWSGNLVTDATWNDFWLNEGFTTYFEHRIMEAVYGREYEEMLALLGLRGLHQTIDEMGRENSDTHLFLNLKERDPDEGMTAIAYDKGHFFLRMLEENIGRKRWDHFLKEYFDKFAFQAMTTKEFLAYLKEQLIKGNNDLERKLRLQEWIYGPGLPDNCPQIQSTALEQVEDQANAFIAGTSADKLQVDNWTTHHWLCFLRTLPKALSLEQMKQLDDSFQLTQTNNSEILHDWLLHAISHDYQLAYPALEKFLTTQGRRKFLQPLYSSLAETPEGMQRASRIYKKARPSYHSVSTGTIDEILEWK